MKVLRTTTGPGLTNALTGLLAARDEGATVIAVSACTSASLRGRFAIQESGPQTLPRGLYESGPLFHFAHRFEDERDWPDVARQLARGIARRRGFIAHVAVPTMLQSTRVERMSGGFDYLEGGRFQQKDDILIDDYYARQQKVRAGDSIM